MNEAARLVYRHERRLGRGRFRSWWNAWLIGRAVDSLGESQRRAWLAVARLYDAMEAGSDPAAEDNHGNV